MALIGVTSLFKGDAKPPSGPHEDEWRIGNEEAITGHEFYSKDRIQQRSYLQGLHAVKGRNRQLVENVSRVVAATVHALMLQRGGDEPRLIFVEGSDWDWGKKPRKGAQTNKDIYDGVIPEEVRSILPKPIVEAYSSRTLDELIKVCGITRELGGIRMDAITHSYHKDRSAQIARGVVQKNAPAMAAPIVITPEAITREIRVSNGNYDDFLLFAKDIIQRAEPEEDVLIKETKKEWWLSLLMKVREKTGRDPERWILNMMKRVGKR